MRGTVIGALILAVATPVPDADRSAVLAVVDAAFAGIAAKDEAAIRAHLRPTGTATVIIEIGGKAPAVRNFDLGTWAGVDAGPQRFEERMIAPTVMIDGSMAAVWGRYSFAIDETVRHCGYQHFDLVREADVWKIQNVTWSVRTAGCESAS